MINREQLELEIRQLEDEADQYRRAGNETMCNNKLVEAMEKREELSRMESEAIITETAEEITSSMELFKVGDDLFALEELAKDHDSLSVLRSGLKTTSNTQAQKVLKLLDELNNQKSTHDMHMALKQEQVDNLLTERDQLQASNAQLQLERDDMTEKRDAAAQQLAEAQAEIARLNSHVDDLRKEIAVGSTNAVNVIDITSDEQLEAAAKRLRAKQEQAAAEKRAAAEAAKIPVYDVKEVFRSQDGTYTTFKFAETGEYGEILWTEFNSLYRKMEDDEVSRFRAELEAAKADIPESMELVSSDMELAATIEAPTLPSEVQDAHPTNGVDGNNVEGQDVPDGDSGIAESFEQETRRRLAELEYRASCLEMHGIGNVA